jgi:DnaJ domain
MSYLIATLIAILVFSGGLTRILSKPPKWLSRSFQQFMGVAALAFTAVLLYKTRYELAIPVGIAAIALLGAFDKLKAHFQGGETLRGENTQGNADPRSVNLSLTEQEAYEILGLQRGASEAEVMTAYRQLITRTHPDSGGSSYLAARVNAARDRLLKKV